MVSATDFRIGWRKLLADPGYACVVVGGLAIAIASVTLFIAYLSAVLQADADVPEPDRVVRLEEITHTPGADHDWIPDSPMVFFDHWAKAGVPVAAATRYYLRDMSVRSPANLSLERVGFTDADIAKVFGLTALAGDIAEALRRPDGAVLTRSAAKRIFGTENVIGQGMQIAGSPFTVLAVMPDRPAASVIPAPVLVNITSKIMPEPFRLTGWESIRGRNYVRLLPGVTADDAAARADAYFQQTPNAKEFAATYGSTIATMRAIALPQLALRGAGTAVTRRLVAGLGLASAIILLLAAINYVNLSVVRTIGRQKEIGIRKALGASPARVAGQFVSEAIVVSAVALALGLLLAWLVAPLVGGWLMQPLANTLWKLTTLLAALAGTLLLGVVAGIYPAWLARRVNCAESLAGRGHAETRAGMWIRRALTVLQFAAALALVSTTLVVLLQTAHAGGASPGYDAASVIAIDVPVDMRDKRVLALRDALAHLPGVQAVGLAWDVPGRFQRNTTVLLATPSGQNVMLAYNAIGPGFFQSYGVAPLAGRVFDPELDRQGNGNVIIVNARAARLLGYPDPGQAVGTKFRAGDQSVEIVGVVPDIRQRSLRDDQGAVAYGIAQSFGVNVLSVRSRNAQETLRALPAVWSAHFPDEVMRAEPVDMQLARLYDGDARLGKLIGVGGAIALALAAFGLYALSAYTVRRRTLEIVIRKLYGATPRNIAWLLARDLSVPLGLGALIGLPIAAWLGVAYLSAFVDRAPGAMSSLVVALFATGLVAMLATARHTTRAMKLLPAEALRR